LPTLARRTSKCLFLSLYRKCVGVKNLVCDKKCSNQKHIYRRICAFYMILFTVPCKNPAAAHGRSGIPGYRTGYRLASSRRRLTMVSNATPGSGSRQDLARTVLSALIDERRVDYAPRLRDPENSRSRRAICAPYSRSEPVLSLRKKRRSSECRECSARG